MRDSTPMDILEICIFTTLVVIVLIVFLTLIGAVKW